jgi:DNA-binding PadR family transcriptional regulator
MKISMLKLSNAEAALLGLLSEQPMYPYQIEQEVKYRDMRFWTDLSMSSIYKLLRKLEKEDMVTRENQVSSGNRLQKLYSISKKGKTTLQNKLKEILRIPEHMRWQIDIGMYNNNLLSKKQVREALNENRNELLKKIKGYQDLLAFLTESKCQEHRFALAKRPVFLFEAEIRWIDSYLFEMENTKQGEEK